jgi:hypothetical protein
VEEMKKYIFFKFIISDLRNISEVAMRVFCGQGDEPLHFLKINIFMI